MHRFFELPELLARKTIDNKAFGAINLTRKLLPCLDVYFVAVQLAVNNVIYSTLFKLSVRAGRHRLAWQVALSLAQCLYFGEPSFDKVFSGTIRPLTHLSIRRQKPLHI